MSDDAAGRRRGDLSRAVDAAVGAYSPDHGDALSRWLAPTGETRVEQIGLAGLSEPYWRQPVDTSDPAFRALKASVRASGILQPLLVRPLPEGGMQVISGVRRLRAARETGHDTVPVTVRELTEAQAIVGAWDAVVRQPVTVDVRALIARRLTEGGMPAGEVAVLLRSLQVVGGSAAAAPAPPAEAPVLPVKEPEAPAKAPEAPPESANEPQSPAVAAASSAQASAGASAGILEAALDWRAGATVGTFLFVLCVVYVIVIYGLGSTTLLAPALAVGLTGAAVAVLSMARSRPVP